MSKDRFLVSTLLSKYDRPVNLRDASLYSQKVTELEGINRFQSALVSKACQLNLDYINKHGEDYSTIKDEDGTSTTLRITRTFSATYVAVTQTLETKAYLARLKSNFHIHQNYSPGASNLDNLDEATLLLEPLGASPNKHALIVRGGKYGGQDLRLHQFYSSPKHEKKLRVAAFGCNRIGWWNIVKQNEAVWVESIDLSKIDPNFDPKIKTFTTVKWSTLLEKVQKLSH